MSRLLLGCVLPVAAVGFAVGRPWQLSTANRSMENAEGDFPAKRQGTGVLRNFDTTQRRATIEGAPTMGSPECPCLPVNSPKLASARPLLQSLGLPAGYGEGGCKQHSRDVDKVGCAGNTASFCTHTWCYVDPELCALDLTKCEAAGGKPGSSVSPYCRTRGSKLSPHVVAAGNTSAEIPLYFSYETCGNLDEYSPSRLSSSIAGHVLRVAITDGMAYAQKTGRVSPLRYIGNPTILESSFTACVHDVAVGNYDLCIGDFWVTPERMSMVQFVQSFGQDYFYLVAHPEKQNTPPWASMQEAENVTPSVEKATLGETLGKPFLPFSNELWAIVISFLIFSALVMAATDKNNIEDYDNRSTIAIFFKALYFVLLGYVSGGAVNGPASVPGRTAAIGFGFFVLITLASYTANLATILVSKSTGNGIQSIEQAIAEQVTICVSDAVKSLFLSQYPSMLYILADYSHTGRMIATGKCGAAIVQESAYGEMQRGAYHMADCRAMDAGLLTAEEAQCYRDSNGGIVPSRDCWIQKVGGVLASVPIAMPARNDLIHPLSHRMRNLISAGRMNEYYATYERLLSPSQCSESASYQKYQNQSRRTLHSSGWVGSRRAAAGGVAGGVGTAAASAAGGLAGTDVLEEMRLPYDSMAGTMFISVLLMMAALILAAIERFSGKTIQELLRLQNPDGDNDIVQGDIGISNEHHGRKHVAPSLHIARVSSNDLAHESRDRGQGAKLDEMYAMLCRILEAQLAAADRPPAMEVVSALAALRRPAAASLEASIVTSHSKPV